MQWKVTHLLIKILFYYDNYMKCPICDHQNKKDSFVSKDEKQVKCPQCETDLETISLLSRMNDSREMSIENKKDSYGILWNILKVILILILLLIFGKALILFSNFLDKNDQVNLRYNLLQDEIQKTKSNITFARKKNDENLLKLKKELTEKGEKYKEKLFEINKRLDVVQKQNVAYQKQNVAYQKQNEKLKNLSEMELVYYNGKESLWKFSEKVYGEGRFFPLLLYYNVLLKSKNNKPQYLRVISDKKESIQAYDKIIFFSKKNKTYYNYITKKNDTFSKIFKKFKGVIVKSKRLLININKKLQYKKNKIIEGQKILLPFR